MKGADWSFKKSQANNKYLTDMEDTQALSNALSDYHNLVKKDNYNSIDYFSSGFMRGLKWCIDKYNIKVKE